MNRITRNIAIGLAAIALLGVACGNTPAPAPETVTVTAAPAPETVTAAPVAPTTEPTVAPATGPVFTVSQGNAVSTATDYLSTMAFSESGLIDQLEYDGYSNGDSSFAVSHISVDWNEQAVNAAQEYLNVMPFSKAGLIDQLKYDGFSTQQAAYGVDQAYR